VPLFTAQKITAVKLFLWKKYRSAQETNNDGVSNGKNGGSISTHLHKSTWSSCLMSTASTKAPVDARSSTFHLRPKKLSERHGSTAAAESLQGGHPERSVGAVINYTKCQHTGPSSEAKISRSPALSCPTATCLRQSAPSSQNSRREDCTKTGQ
jgi:hypothetical protein